jgi:hypothetical protein
MFKVVLTILLVGVSLFVPSSENQKDLQIEIKKDKTVQILDASADADQDGVMASLKESYLP